VNKAVEHYAAKRAATDPLVAPAMLCTLDFGCGYGTFAIPAAQIITRAGW